MANRMLQVTLVALTLLLKPLKQFKQAYAKASQFYQTTVTLDPLLYQSTNISILIKCSVYVYIYIYK